MRRIIIACAGLILCAALHAESDLIGKTEAELVAAKGPPLSKVEGGNRAIYRFSDSEVTLTSGKVTGIRLRNLNREQAVRERGAASVAERKATGETRANKQVQQPVATQGQVSLLDDMRRRSAAAEAERREKAETAARKAERDADFARRESLRVEINRLKADTRQAYKNGDKKTSGVMAEEYRAKVRERDALEKKIQNSPR